VQNGVALLAFAVAGKVDGLAKPALAWRRPAAAVVDAKHGFAYPAIDLALDALPKAARQSGVAAAAIMRSHHCGVVGHPVERLAGEGLLALMFANTPAAIAPWGSAKAVFGTNPIAFACPLPGKPPVVVDLSLSKVARGNILAAKQIGMNGVVLGVLQENTRVDVERQLVDREPVGQLRQGLQHPQHPVGDPTLVLHRLLADHRPLLGGGLVHPREGASRRSHALYSSADG